MDQKEEIVKYLTRRGSASGKALREHLGISRQALNVHLRRLIESGKVVKSGSTRAARYSLPSRAPGTRTVSRVLTIKGLDESRVYEELEILLNLHALLRKNVKDIVRYAFTEMLNNAIEHSMAERCTVRVSVGTAWVSFDVRDRGVGVFRSIASKSRLEDEHAALVELLKGKTTSAPATHTGEGIFFTSKAADLFVLRSHRIQMEWDTARDDVFVSQRRFMEGTDVKFSLRRTTRRRLENVFSEYAPPEYDFQFLKTRVFVKLLRFDYISRSEAKRLLVNLHRFREIVLDFKDVKSIGQGFADEIFRVFAKAHPEITISVQNALPPLDAMLRHVRRR